MRTHVPGPIGDVSNNERNIAALRQIAFHFKGIGMSKQKRKPKPKLVTASIEVRKGNNPTNTPVVRKGDYRDLIGHAIAASPTRDQTAALLQQAVDLVSWTIIPSPKD